MVRWFLQLTGNSRQLAARLPAGGWQGSWQLDATQELNVSTLNGLGDELGGNDECAVYLDSNASLEEVDRDDQETLVWFGPEQDPLGTCQQPVCESDTLSLPKIRMGSDRESDTMYLLDGHDLALRNYGQAIPRFAQDFHEASHLAEFDIALAVHGMVKEKITGKRGNVDPMPDTVASGPHSHHWQEKVESFCSQLVIHHLFEVAASPKDVPPRLAQLALRMAYSIWRMV